MKKILAAALSAVLLMTVGLAGCGQANKDAKYVILDEPLADEEYVIGFRKTDVALKEEVNKILSDLKVDGSLGEISTKWFGSDVTTVSETYEKAETTDDSLQKSRTRASWCWAWTIPSRPWATGTRIRILWALTWMWPPRCAKSWAWS